MTVAGDAGLATRTTWGFKVWVNVSVWVAYIHYTDDPDSIMPIFQGDPAAVEQKWKAIIAAAKTYLWAEQAAPPKGGFSGVFENRPRSLYMPLQTNSNTFARYAARSAGLTFTEMEDGNFHSGYDEPSQNTDTLYSLLGYHFGPASTFYSTQAPWKGAAAAGADSRRGSRRLMYLVPHVEVAVVKPRRRRAVWVLFLALSGLVLGLVALSVLMLPWVDVRVHLNEQQIVFDITHVGIDGILGFGVENSEGRVIWAINLSYEKGHRIVYGSLPTGGNRLGRQVVPAEGQPEDIHGKHVTVWMLYAHDGVMATEFRKTIDIPR